MKAYKIQIKALVIAKELCKFKMNSTFQKKNS